MRNPLFAGRRVRVRVERVRGPDVGYLAEPDRRGEREVRVPWELYRGGADLEVWG